MWTMPPVVDPYDPDPDHLIPTNQTQLTETLGDGINGYSNYGVARIVEHGQDPVAVGSTDQSAETVQAPALDDGRAAHGKQAEDTKANNKQSENRKDTKETKDTKDTKANNKQGKDTTDTDTAVDRGKQAEDTTVDHGKQVEGTKDADTTVDHGKQGEDTTANNKQAEDTTADHGKQAKDSTDKKDK